MGKLVAKLRDFLSKKVLSQKKRKRERKRKSGRERER